MSTEYTLTYFNITAWAEPARYILSAGGAKWKDNRLPFVGIGLNKIPDDIKAVLPYGQVPLLEFEGKRIVQSLAIARFLAKKFNLTGKDDFEAAKVDEVVDALKDMVGLFSPYFAEKDAEKQAAGMKTGAETARTKYLPKFNEFIEANGGHLVGGSLSWADIIATCYIAMLENVTQAKLTTGFTALEGLIKTVNASPGIKEYLAQRPNTAF